MPSSGHVNEKNFVGLATDGDYVTCGSENNGLYIYYKGEKQERMEETSCITATGESALASIML